MKSQYVFTVIMVLVGASGGRAHAILLNDRYIARSVIGLAAASFHQEPRIEHRTFVDAMLRGAIDSSAAQLAVNVMFEDVQGSRDAAIQLSLVAVAHELYLIGRILQARWREPAR